MTVSKLKELQGLSKEMTSETKTDQALEWNPLPNEIWIHNILTLLPVRDLLTLSETSKMFKTLSLDPLLWRTLTLDYQTIKKKFKCSRMLVERCSKLTNLKITHDTFPLNASYRVHYGSEAGPGRGRSLSSIMSLVVIAKETLSILEIDSMIDSWSESSLTNLLELRNLQILKMSIRKMNASLLNEMRALTKLKELPQPQSIYRNIRVIDRGSEDMVNELMRTLSAEEKQILEMGNVHRESKTMSTTSRKRKSSQSFHDQEIAQNVTKKMKRQKKLNHDPLEVEDNHSPCNSIPNEIWMNNILNLLSVEDLVSVSKTNKKFRTLSLDPSLWKTLTLDYRTIMRKPKCYKDLLQRCSKLRHLKITSTHGTVASPLKIMGFLNQVKETLTSLTIESSVESHNIMELSSSWSKADMRKLENIKILKKDVLEKCLSVLHNIVSLGQSNNLRNDILNNFHLRRRLEELKCKNVPLCLWHYIDTYMDLTLLKTNPGTRPTDKETPIISDMNIQMLAKNFPSLEHVSLPKYAGSSGGFRSLKVLANSWAVQYIKDQELNCTYVEKCS